MRQRTIRAFEVNNFEELQKIVESKYKLIQNYYFILKEKDEKIEKFLKDKSLSYIIENNIFTYNKEIVEEVKIIEKEKIIEKKINTKIYDKIIRSGTEIETDENLIFFNRINDGAKIKSSGNIEIFDECEGIVICDGNYLIINKNIKGTIIFNGENIGRVEKLTIFTENGKRELL